MAITRQHRSSSTGNTVNHTNDGSASALPTNRTPSTPRNVRATRNDTPARPRARIPLLLDSTSTAPPTPLSLMRTPATPSSSPGSPPSPARSLSQLFSPRLHTPFALASPVYRTPQARSRLRSPENKFDIQAPASEYKKHDFMQPKEPLHKTGRNFRAWKQLMKLALSQYPWEELITHPFTPEDIRDYGFEAEDKEVRRYIMFSIDPAIVEALGEPPTAYSAWESICERYEPQDDPEDAEWELFSCRIKESDTVKHHLERMEQLKLSFERSGGRLDEKGWLRVLKRSFATESRPELMLDARRSDHKRVKDFQSYMRKRDGVPSWKPTTTSNASKDLDRSRTTSSLRNCDNCKRPGHPTSQCHYEKGAQERKCTNCSLFGHTKEVCWRPGGDAQRQEKTLTVAKAKVAVSQDEEMKMLREECSRLKDEMRNLRASSDPVLGTAKMALPLSHRLDMIRDLNSVEGHKSVPFIIDTGATAHLVSDRSLFTTYERCEGTIETAERNGSITAVGKGLIRVYGRVGKEQPWHALSFYALHCPNLATNLLSVSRIFDDFDGSIRLEKGFAEILGPNTSPIARAARINNLWTFDFVSEFNEKALLTVGPRSTSRSATLTQFHSAASHIHADLVKDAIMSGRVQGVQLLNERDTPEPCEACIKGKMTKSISPSKLSHASRVGHLLHADILHFEVPSVSGFRMALTMEDSYSCYKWAFPMKTKDAETVLTHWRSVVLLLSKRGFPVLELQTDNGSEFCNKEMDAFNESFAILHRKTVPYAHEMNGRIERTNRTLQEGTRANLFTTNMPLCYWAEALSHLLYTLNRFAATREPGKSPFQLLFGHVPNVGHLLPFGQPVYYFVPPEVRKKLEAKAKFGRILGYEEDASYRVLLPHADVITSRDIRCLPLQYQPLRPLVSTKASHATNTISTASESQLEPVPTLPRRSARVPKPSSKLLEAQIASIASTNSASSTFVPNNLREALHCSESAKWREAIDKENAVLREMGVFTIREMLPTDKPLPGTLVFTRKQDDEGGERFKARFCIRGDLQIAGRDFNETFAQAGDMTGYKLVAAIAMLPDVSPQALDIKGAFLTAPMDDPDICVCLPPLYETTGFSKPVAILNKALYGLRQAPRLFRSHLIQRMSLSGYKPLKSNPTLFYKPSVEGEIQAVAAFWVDDGFAAQWDRALNGHAQSSKTTQGFIEDVKEHFQLKVKDLSTGSTIVGMHMRWNTEQGQIRLSVKEKILNLAERFGLSDANTANTPMQIDALKILESDTSDLNTVFPYRELVGSLLWIGTVARPDVTFAVNVLSRYCDKARSQHVIAIKRVVRYLLKTQDLSLVYGRSTGSVVEIVGYSDADWARNLSDRKSTTGFVIMVNGAAISWKSKKQVAVAKSTAEAEYVAASECATEVEWFRAMLAELRLNPSTSPTSLFVDNQAAIQMTANDVHMSRAKAIDIKFHHIKDLVRKGDISILKIAGTENPADILTKPLPPISHYKCLALLGLS